MNRGNKPAPPVQYFYTGFAFPEPQNFTFPAPRARFRPFYLFQQIVSHT